MATLLTVVGEDAREVFATFMWENEGDNNKIESVLQKFANYCQPRKSVPFERYCFNCRVQEPGESYEQYRTSLRKLSEGCEFASITPEEILRDRLVFGIRDDKVRERLLREPSLTLTKADEICRAAESLNIQMKTITDESSTLIHAVKFQGYQTEKKFSQGNQTGSDKQSIMPSKPDMPECWYCGRKHELRKRELCPAFRKLCNKCHKPNHFANKCRSTAAKGSVKLVDDNGNEVFPTQIAAVSLDDSQFVTLKLKLGNFLRFQVDTGAQCNVIPLALYRQATNDHKLRKAKLGKSQITAYGGTTLQVTGQVLMEVERGNRQYTLECKLVNCTNIRPLLGRKACLDMEIVAYLDNDALCKPHVGQATVFTLEPTNAMSQQQYYNQHGRDLRPISPGETVRIRLPGQKTWSVGICKALVGPRSYEVNVGNTIYRRNRRHVIHTDELFDTENMDPQTVHPEEGMDNGSAPMEQDGTSTSLTTAVPQEPCTLRRSQRTHRAPHWMEDYIQS